MTPGAPSAIARARLFCVQPTGDYGIDSPGVVRGLWLGVAGALLATVVAGVLDEVTVMAAAFGAALVISMLGLVLVRSSRVAKLRERVRVVDRLALQGDERVLDVGCGRGLLLVEVARRLNDRGRAFGVDHWHALREGSYELVVDAEFAIQNAHVEGVGHQLDMTSADVRSLPFPDGSFDAVVSGLALHHIAGFESRVHAMREIARVLRIDGRVVLVDRRHTRSYVHALRACNFTDVKRSRRIWRLLPPARYVTGTKVLSVPYGLPPVPVPVAVTESPETPVEVAVEMVSETVPEVTEPEPELDLGLDPLPPREAEPEPEPESTPTPLLRISVVSGEEQLELSDAVTGERDGAGHDNETAEEDSSV